MVHALRMRPLALLLENRLRAYKSKCELGTSIAIIMYHYLISYLFRFNTDAGFSEESGSSRAPTMLVRARFRLPRSTCCISNKDVIAQDKNETPYYIGSF